MPRNPIQEERIKRYFIDATKEIIISEGHETLSVRNISQKAGYSYATLYNYFKGISGLTTECIKDFQLDCSAYISKKVENNNSGKIKLKSILAAYIDYLVEYQSLFNLFYVVKLSNNKANQSIVLFLDKLCESEFQFCIENKIYSKEQVYDIKEKIKYMIPGILLSYINRNYPKEYVDFKKSRDYQLDMIIS